MLTERKLPHGPAEPLVRFQRGGSRVLIHAYIGLSYQVIVPLLAAVAMELLGRDY